VSGDNFLGTGLVDDDDDDDDDNEVCKGTLFLLISLKLFIE
jgi:hypothetical protein